MLQQNENEASASLLAVWKMKKAALNALLAWTASKRAKHNKREANVLKAIKLRLTRLLMFMKSWTANRKIKQNMRRKASVFCHSGTKRRVLTKMQAYHFLKKEQQTTICSFRKRVLIRILKSFKLQLTDMKRLDEGYNAVSISQNTKVAYKSIKKWRTALENLRMALYEAEIRHKQKRLASIVRKWKEIVDFKNRSKIITQAIAERNSTFTLKKVWAAWINFTRDPEHKKQKTAVFFYLEHLYSKCIAKLKTHANKRKFQHSLKEYSTVRTKKRIFQRLRQVCKQQKRLRSFVRERESCLRRQLLFELFVYGEQKKIRQKAYIQADETRARFLRLRSFKGFQCEATVHKAKLQAITDKKARAVRQKVLRQWANHNAVTKAIKMSSKICKEKARKKQLARTICSWRLNAGVKSNVAHIMKKRAQEKLFNSFKSLEQYARKKRQNKVLINNAGKIQSESLLRKGFCTLKNIAITKKINSINAATIKLKSQVMIYHAVISGLKLNSAKRREERGRIQRIQACHSLLTLHHYYTMYNIVYYLFG